MHFKNNRGVAGADVAVALTIFIVFISLISSLFLNTVTTSRKVERKSIATNAAVQLIENYKQKSIAELVELTKDENATQNDNGSNELTIKDEDIDKSILGIPELYKEAYKISAKLENYKNEDKVIKFTSIVEYKSGKNDEKIQIETLITKNKNNDELAKLKNIKDINIKRMTLDGASLITVTLEDDSIATSNDVKWRSSDEEVATVTPNGIVMCGEKYGTAIITCIGANGSAQCEVSSEDTKARIIYKNTNDYNCTITGSTTMRGYNNPTIPSGFYAIDTQDAKWVRADTQVDYDKGLVIMDEKGNQFVWVPIDGTTVAYEKWCTNGNSYANCIDDTFPYTDTSEYYGGFWIGRYEAGLDLNIDLEDENQKNNKNIEGTPVIVEGAKPWFKISYNISKTNSENMYNNTHIQSGLVNGTQWDTTMKWLQEINPQYDVSTDCGLWGNYLNNSLSLDRYKNLLLYEGSNYNVKWYEGESTSANASQLIRTGASTRTKAHNISDLAGNLYEWTNEMSANDETKSVHRSSGCHRESNTYTAATRAIVDKTAINSFYGFRVALYLKYNPDNISNNMTIDGASLITVSLNNGDIATSNDVTWSTTDPNVATVTPNGIVMCGNETGEAIITCNVENTQTLYKITSQAKKVYTNSGTANCNITGATTGFSYNNPVIPVGFTAINTIDAKWTNGATQTDYNKGLVIMDNKGNQFVWVPIDGTNVTYEKWEESSPPYVSLSNCPNDELPSGLNDLSSNYGGFWIGRYESGIDVDLGSNLQKNASSASRNTSGTPIIVEGAIPWNFIDYNNAKINAESIFTSSNSFLQSGLISGKQWDTTLKWIQNIGGKSVTTQNPSWGNYKDISLNLDRYNQVSTDNGGTWTNATQTTVGQVEMIRTGASTATKALNISGLAGSMYEWTGEIYNDNDKRVFRGGAFFNHTDDKLPAIGRQKYPKTSLYNCVRFPYSIIYKIIWLNVNSWGRKSERFSASVFLVHFNV